MLNTTVQRELKRQNIAFAVVWQSLATSNRSKNIYCSPDRNELKGQKIIFNLYFIDRILNENSSGAPLAFVSIRLITSIVLPLLL